MIYSWRLLITLFFIITFDLWVCGSAVKVNKLIIPKVVPANTPVVLDCDYTLDNHSKEEGLVVKWYFNDDMLVYQWIIGSPPLSIGVLRNRVNLNYTADPSPNHLYRAINILNPTPDLTGNYTCVVSTLESEDSQTKQMIVLVPPSSLRIEQEYIAAKYEISCVARGVSPIPNLTLRSGQRILNDTVVTVIPNNNAYDVRVKAIVYIPKNHEQFTCQLDIPHTTYSATKTEYIYAGYGYAHGLTPSSSSALTSSFYLLILLALSNMFTSL